MNYKLMVSLMAVICLLSSGFAFATPVSEISKSLQVRQNQALNDANMIPIHYVQRELKPSPVKLEVGDQIPASPQYPRTLQSNDSMDQSQSELFNLLFKVR